MKAPRFQALAFNWERLHPYIEDVLAAVGLSLDSLPEDGQEAVAVLSEAADILELRDVGTSSYVTGKNHTHTRPSIK